jgi:hypothetical protein
MVGGRSENERLGRVANNGRFFERFATSGSNGSSGQNGSEPSLTMEARERKARYIYI